MYGVRSSKQGINRKQSLSGLFPEFRKPNFNGPGFDSFIASELSPFPWSS